MSLPEMYEPAGILNCIFRRTVCFPFNAPLPVAFESLLYREFLQIVYYPDMPVDLFVGEAHAVFHGLKLLEVILRSFPIYSYHIFMIGICVVDLKSQH